MDVAPTRFVGRIFPETMDKKKRTDRLPGMIARFISVNFFKWRYVKDGVYQESLITRGDMKLRMSA